MKQHNTSGHSWVIRDGWTSCSRCGQFRYPESKACPHTEIKNDPRALVGIPYDDAAEVQFREMLLATPMGNSAQRAGSCPHTVEVGMLLCRPADGRFAEVWRVGELSSVEHVDYATLRLSSWRGDGEPLDVPVICITHPDGGWVLAADWPAAEGSR